VICPEESQVLSLGAVSSVLPCKHVIFQSCPSWIPRWIAQSKTDTQWRQGYQAFLLLSVNCGPKKGVKTDFSAKAVSKYLLSTSAENRDGTC
jgi:hypothetical protein